MASKAFTGLILAFWVVMMAALVRVEFFPSPSRLARASTDQVLRRVFSNPEPAQMVVYYKDEKLGTCNVTITTNSTGTLTAYDVSAELTVRLNVFGTPSHLYVRAKPKFDARFNLKTFDLETKVAGSRLVIKDNQEARRLDMTVDTGDGPQERQVKYEEVNGAGLLNALGLPGLSGLGGLGLSSANTNLLRQSTHAYHDRLTIAGLSQQAYLIDSKFDHDGAIWSKIWVDDQGTILRVETSMGLRMESTSIDSLAGAAEGKTASQSRPLQ